MRQLMGGSQFNRKLATFFGHAKATREELQDLLEDALLQAHHPANGGKGSTSRLTNIMHACKRAKLGNVKVVQKYIQAHIDGKWCKLKDGEYGFKYNGTASATMPDVPWYEYDPEPNNPKIEVDLVKSLKNILAKAAKAEKEGGKVEHEELLPVIRKALAEATAEVHKPKAVEDY